MKFIYMVKSFVFLPLTGKSILIVTVGVNSLFYGYE